MTSGLVFRILQRNCVRKTNWSGSFLKTNNAAISTLSRCSMSHFKLNENSLLHTPPKNSSMALVQKSMSSSAHDHVTHWTAERILSVVLMGAIPAAIAVPSPYLEYFLALSLTVHAHWGVEAIVVDYIRPSIFGSVIPKLSVGAVYALSVLTLAGMFYFIYTDVGLINAVKLLWKV